jgi:hypothetical protein
METFGVVAIEDKLVDFIFDTGGQIKKSFGETSAFGDDLLGSGRNPGNHVIVHDIADVIGWSGHKTVTDSFNGSLGNDAAVQIFGVNLLNRSTHALGTKVLKRIRA